MNQIMNLIDFYTKLNRNYYSKIVPDYLLGWKLIYQDNENETVWIKYNTKTQINAQVAE